MPPETQTTAEAKKPATQAKKPGRKPSRRDRQRRLAERRKRLISSVLLAEKCGVTVRTIDRWELAGIILRAKRINKRRYWDEDTEPLTDNATATAEAA